MSVEGNRAGELMTMPLEGLRVLDLTTGIAGAYCAKLLVDGGADAIKVEGPLGDPLRRWWASGLGDEPSGTGALFEWLHASEQSVVADLATAEGLAAVRQLVAQCDVVLESFPAGQIEAFGLGPAQVRALRRQAVLVSISDLGRGVSQDDDVAWSELLLQSLSGSVHGRGHPTRFPLAAGGRLGEWATGVYAAIGALIAWRRAKENGVGEHVDVSRLESMAVTLVGYASLMRNIQGEGAKPYTRSVEIPSVERASDGWIGFCTVTNAQWQAFAVMAEQYERAEGEWALLSYRQAHRSEAEAMISAFTSQHRVEEILEESAQFRVPAAPVVGGAKIPETEPFRSMGVYVRPPNGRFLAPRPPFRFSRNELRSLGASPSLGGYTEHGWTTERAESGESAARPRSTGKALPFGGMRVVDFSAFWAGPYATALLAALGADVIKIESIDRPDPIRFSSSAPPSDPQWYEKSAIFGSCNLNKRGITLALDTPEGRDLALRLIAGADVVVENFTPRVMERFGLGYSDLAQVRPDLVMVRMSAFGASGPWRERGGFAQTMEQITGMAWITGYADGPPVIPRGACDPIGGMHTIVALLMALEHRDRTGEGQLVEVSLMETSANVAAEVVIEWSAYGRELVRDGNHGPEGSPQGVYRCKGADSWVALAVLDDADWHRLVAALGAPSWAQSSSFATVVGRRQHAEAIDRNLSEWSGRREAEDAARTLRHHRVPSTVVVPADRIDEIPQLRGRDFWVSIDHPMAGCHEGPGWPLHFSGILESWPGRPAPTLGQHNREVLVGDLGLSVEEFEDLARRGIVGETMRGR